MDGNDYLPDIVSAADTSSQSPAVYIPTPLARKSTSSSSATTPQKEHDARQKYRVQAGDTYSPSVPGIRIVKRKAKPVQCEEEEEAGSSCQPEKRRATEEDEDAGLAALKLQPKKGIIKKYPISGRRVTRKLVFADARNLPLVHIKEIEKLTSIHSNYADYRCAERNEAEAVFGGNDKRQGLKNVRWEALLVKNRKISNHPPSVSGQREEKRIAEQGIMRSGMFGLVTLEDIPELNEIAARDLANYRPTSIPTVSIPFEQDTLSALRELPLPGRPRQQNPYVPLLQIRMNQPPSNFQLDQREQQMIDQQMLEDYPNHHVPQLFGQQIREQKNNQYAQVFENSEPSFNQPPPSTRPQVPVIQQVFNESDVNVTNSYYVSSSTTTATSNSPPVTTKPAEKSAFELPANLKEMLSQLKKKGFMSSEDSPPPPTTSTDPLTTAMQTAQQMMQKQETLQQVPQYNSYSSEPPATNETGVPMDGYVATFATSSEMVAQEHRQDSRNQEGWTQSGWKIHEPCVYFMNRPGGCNRGDQCRFIHDEEMRRQKMAELPQRNYNNHHHNNHHHDNHNFRARGRGGGFRGNFRGGNNHHQHDRDFRDRPYNNGPRNNRFNDGNDNNSHNNRGGGFARSRFDQKQEHNASMAPSSNSDAPSKRPRISRFDQKEDDGIQAHGDVDHRPARRNRFDEAPAQRTAPRNSRFDQPADKDDRAAQTAYAIESTIV